jgi:hypothetical protein
MTIDSIDDNAIYGDVLSFEQREALDSLGVKWRGRNVQEVYYDIRDKAIEHATASYQNAVLNNSPNITSTKSLLDYVFEKLPENIQDLEEADDTDNLSKYDPVTGTQRVLIAAERKKKKKWWKIALAVVVVVGAAVAVTVLTGNPVAGGAAGSAAAGALSNSGGSDHRRNSDDKKLSSLPPPIVPRIDQAPTFSPQNTPPAALPPERLFPSSYPLGNLPLRHTIPTSPSFHPDKPNNNTDFRPGDYQQNNPILIPNTTPLTFMAEGVLPPMTVIEENKSTIGTYNPLSDEDAAPAEEIKSQDSPSLTERALNALKQTGALFTHSAWKALGLVADNILGMGEIFNPTLPHLKQHPQEKKNLKEAWEQDVVPTVHEKIDKTFSTDIKEDFDRKNDSAFKQFISGILCNPFASMGSSLPSAEAQAAKVLNGGKAVQETALLQKELSALEVGTARTEALKDVSSVERARSVSQEAALIERELAVANRAAGLESKVGSLTNNAVERTNLSPIRVQPNGIWEIDGKNIKRFDSTIGSDKNKIRHVFDNPEHQVNLFASTPQSAFEKVTEALIEVDRAGGIPANQLFITRVKIDGHVVEVRGIVSEGELKIGTFFIPKD